MPHTPLLSKPYSLRTLKVAAVTQRATLGHRRKIGSYYTPVHVADVLSEWAIRAPTDAVLEPSFGGCNFLESSVRHLTSLGCVDPKAQIFGCDVDPQAFTTLFSQLGLTQVAQHFLLADFLELDPSAFGGCSFEAVIGNPPYVRHHLLTDRQRLKAREIRDAMIPSLSLQASLWAHFIVHASSFLKQGGRMAWLLPTSFTHTCYAEPIRRFLREWNEVVRVVAVRERLFRHEGAEEGTIILLTEGWRPKAGGPREWCESTIESPQELSSLLSGPKTITANTKEYDPFTKLAQKLRHW